MILATYHDGNNYFGLSDEDLKFLDYDDDHHFAVVLSLTGTRSYCNENLICGQCPFTSGHIDQSIGDTCQLPLVARNPKFLHLFGFTPESNPEYFV